ncbi:MAG: DMT family transporter [Acidobacteriota bacterium]|nr:DMT family transporter [Acidobacteriota bacterium]
MAQRRLDIRPHLALLAVQIMFGTWPVVGKIALRSLPSAGLVSLRLVGAAAAFVVVGRFVGCSSINGTGDYLRLALYGLMGVVLNQLLFTKGLSLSTAINATLLGTAIPVFTLLVGVVINRERPSLRTTLGVAVAAGGVIYLINPWNADFSSDKTLGNLLLIANTAFYGAYIALSQDVLRRYGALTVITWVFLFGALGTLPLGTYYLAQTPAENFSVSLWLAVLYIILVPTVGAYYLNAWALERVTPSTVAAYIYLQPLIAAVLAPLLLGESERWGIRTAIAAALIFAGVALATWQPRNRVLDEVSEHPEAFGH